MQDFIGQQLGNYRLLGLIGHGAFANVYLGEHIYLRTQVAIKVASEKMEHQDAESFLKEAQTIAALKHPHILRVLDFGIEGTALFLVMEYISKGTLREKHPRGSIVPFPVVLSYTKQIAMALQYAHDHKVVHRDVKPGNILAETEDKVVLSDFGLAISAHQTQSLSMQKTAGTTLYMAPEQFRGKARPASDQYALGVAIYEWLSGTCPFEGSSSIEIAMQHILDRPPPLQERVPNISAEMDQVILRALAKEPEQRFASIQEFANALEEAYQRTLLDSTQSALPPQPSIQRVKIKQPRETVLTYQAHSKEVSAIDWSPEGTCIVSGGRDEIVQLWHAFTDKRILTYRGHSNTKGHPSTVGVSVVAWSPDGSRIASAGNDETAQVWNGTVQVWKASTGEHILSYYGHFGSVRAAAWSPDSKYIASLGGWDSTVHLWDANTGRCVLTYQGHSRFVHEVVWSPDGTRLASGSDDKTVQIWDANTGVQLKIYDGHSESVTAVTWSPDGTYIGSGSSDGMIQVWETSTGNQIWHHHAHSNYSWPCLKWSPDGTLIAALERGNSIVNLWDASTGELIKSYQGHSSLVEAIAWSPNSSYIASGDYQGTVHVWAK